MSGQHKITLYFDVSEDALGPASDFDAIAGILDALSTRFAYNPYAHAFLITRAEEARKIAEYIQKNPQDVGLR